MSLLKIVVLVLRIITIVKSSNEGSTISKQVPPTTGIDRGVSKLRQDGNTTLTADDIGTALVKATLEKITAVGWHTSKRVRQQYTSVPYRGGREDLSMYLAVRKGVVTGLGSLASEAASFESEQLLKVRLGLRELSMGCEYQVQVPKVGVAPANAVRGRAQERIPRAWIDTVVTLDDTGLPLSLKTFEAGSEDGIMTQTTNLQGNGYAPIYEVAFRNALRTLVLNTLETNIKVKFNQGLQEIKAAGNYSQWLQ